MNYRIKALGETVLRVKDLQALKQFYTEVIGLDILQELEGIIFLKVAAGYGGHTQILGLFQESMLVPFQTALRDHVRIEHTSLHHFAFEIDRTDYAFELERLKSLGVEVMTTDHRWCRWRSIYIEDPEGNIVELVCYDESICRVASPVI